MTSRVAFLIGVLVYLVSCQEDYQLQQIVEAEPPPVAYEPSWVYNCIPDKGCQRSQLSQAETEFSHAYTSIDVCRSVCGRFGSLWPRPVTAALSSLIVDIHPNNLRYDMMNVPVEAREMIAKMSRVASDIILAECNGNVTEHVDSNIIVHITVNSPDITLTLETDEEYTLHVQTKGNDVAVTIAATTVYGARHGLETLTQLIVGEKQPHSTKCGLKMVSGANIRDKPAYKYRGFLLDTSRNFIPIKDIKRMINGMAATKMNVFHWHVTDSHSFPLESRRVPQFTKYGAYSSEEIYSFEEVRDLINFALVRGVRVVIEIDAPAHAGNGWQWGKEYGLGDLAVCVNAPNWRDLCIQPPCGQLNPANPDMYRILRELYRDIADLLPKPALFHMGGDEVFFRCWNSSEQIVQYMSDKGFGTTVEGYIRLWAEFHANALQAWDEQLAEAGGVSPQPVMLWSSELTQMTRIQNYLDYRRYIIEVWEPISSPLLGQLLRMGYKTVSVPKDIWYLDHGFWGNTRYSNWRKMYSHVLPKDTNMLGGEVAMWSEYVDANVIDTRIWPRAAAVGERLWSDPAYMPRVTSAAEMRLQRHRDRLMARGLRPDALSPGWCAYNDGRCV